MTDGLSRERTDDDAREAFAEVVNGDRHELAVEVGRELLRLRERVAALEAERAKAPQVECACHPGVRWPVDRWGHRCQITVAEEQVAALTAQLARAREALRGVLSFISVQEEAVGIAGHIYPTQVVGIALGPDVDALLLAARAALSGGIAAGKEER